MFDFDFGLGEDLDLLRESVAAFADDKVAPRAVEIVLVRSRTSVCF